MRAHERALALAHLDFRLKHLRKLDLEVPSRGWVREIRMSLGMTMQQLGDRMNVSMSRIARIEHDEVSGATTLVTLRNAAVALNCSLFHAVVPVLSLNEILLQRAEEKARAMMMRREHSADRAAHIEQQLRARLAFGSPRGLWDTRD